MWLDLIHSTYCNQSRKHNHNFTSFSSKTLEYFLLRSIEKRFSIFLTPFGRYFLNPHPLPSTFALVSTIIEHRHSTLKILYSNLKLESTGNNLEEQQRYLIHVIVLYGSSKTKQQPKICQCVQMRMGVCVCTCVIMLKSKNGKNPSVFRTN